MERYWLYRLPEAAIGFGYSRPWSVTDDPETAKGAKASGWDVLEVAPVVNLDEIEDRIAEALPSGDQALRMRVRDIFREFGD